MPDLPSARRALLRRFALHEINVINGSDYDRLIRLGHLSIWPISFTIGSAWLEDH
jgi:hypothetical protein